LAKLATGPTSGNATIRASGKARTVKVQRTFQFPLTLFGILPMINVLFLVLVFFTVGSRFVQQPGVQVILPATTFAMGPQHNAQIVSLTGAPAPAIYFRGQKVALEELLVHLDENKSADRRLIIKADKSSPVGVRDQIMNEALRRGYPVILAGEIAPR
jgi:biopolymer transport protein ExbD